MSYPRRAESVRVDTSGAFAAGGRGAVAAPTRIAAALPATSATASTAEAANTNAPATLGGLCRSGFGVGVIERIGWLLGRRWHEGSPGGGESAGRGGTYVAPPIDVIHRNT